MPRITKDTIIGHLKSAISQEVIAQEFQIHIDHWIDQWGNLKEGEGADSIVIQQLSIQTDQRQFSANVIIGSNPPRKILGKIEWLIEIPVLKNPIAKSDIISESDIGWQKFPADKLSPSTVTKKEELLGKTSKHTPIKIGSPVNRSDLQSPLIVKKGDGVQISYKSPSMVITTQATALSNGSFGESIMLETSSSKDGSGPVIKKTIQAKITGPNQAEIGRIG